MKSLAAGAIIICAALTGWGARAFHDQPRCDYLSGNVPRYLGYITTLPAVDHPIPPALISSIYTCYALHPYPRDMSPPRIPRLKDARRIDSSHYLLAFELWGVSDVSLLFVVDDNGKVEKAYGYPYTL